jgi:hypothetical protein
MLRFEPHDVKEDAVSNFLPEGFTLDEGLDLSRSAYDDSASADDD